MNLIDESPTLEGVGGGKKFKVVLILAIIVLAFIIIGLLAFLSSRKDGKLSLTVDGNKCTNIVKTSLQYNDETINENYVAIKDLVSKMSSRNGYEYKDGDDRVQSTNKCYVTNTNESVFFEADTKQIYKVSKTTNKKEFFTLDNPIILSDGKIYIGISDIATALSTSYTLQGKANIIETIGYKEDIYNKKEDSRFKVDSLIQWDVSYQDKKLLKYNMVITKDSTGELGISKVTIQSDKKNNTKEVKAGEHIVPSKYKSIEYVEKYDQLIVETADGKKGVVQLSIKVENGKEQFSNTQKAKPIYDDIEPINENYFLVTEIVSSDKTKATDVIKKYGIIKAPVSENSEETEILATQYDEIGIDLSKFPDNGLDSKFIIYDNIIPVQKSGLWGAVDISGNDVIRCSYDDIGYCENNDPSKNVLIIPEVNGIVFKATVTIDSKKTIKYYVMDKNNKKSKRVDEIYKEFVDGKQQYTAVIDGKKYDFIQYWKAISANTDVQED